MTRRPKRLLKPQNIFPPNVRKKATDVIRQFLRSYDLDEDGASRLAEKLIDLAIKKKRSQTSPGGPDLCFSDGDKIEGLSIEAQRIAFDLDEAGKLIDLLEDQPQPVQPDEGELAEVEDSLLRAIKINKGSPKQIKWARAIAERTARDLAWEVATGEILIDQAVAKIANPDAKWWIDNRPS